MVETNRGRESRFEALYTTCQDEFTYILAAARDGRITGNYGTRCLRLSEQLVLLFRIRSKIPNHQLSLPFDAGSRSLSEG